MKFHFTCFFLFFLLFSCNESTIPALPHKNATTVEQVLENYIAGIGGQENIDKLKNTRYTYITYHKADSIETEVIQVNGKKSIQYNSPTKYMIFDAEDSTAVTVSSNYLCSFPSNDVKDILGSTYILDHLYELQTADSLEFLGERNIGDSLHVYQIKQVSKNGISKISEYDKKTGLLLHITQEPYFNNIYKNYTRYNGVLFADLLESQNKDYKMKIKERSLNVEIDESIFGWNDEKHKNLVGTWVAQNSASSHRDFFELQLYKDRSGKEVTGIVLPDGTRKEADFLTQPFSAWNCEGDTLMMSTYDIRYNKWRTRRLKLENQTDSSFDAYYVYPEFNEKSRQNNEDLRAIMMHYKKQK